MSYKTTFQDRATKNDADAIHAVGTIVEMALIMAAMVLFDFFPDRIGIIRSLMDPSSFGPLLAPEFQDHMPWLNVYWGLALGLCALNLAVGRWNIYTRWADLCLNILAACIFLRMLLGGPLIAYPALTLLVKFALAAGLIGTSIEIIRKVVRLLGGEQTSAQLKAS